MLLLKSPAGSRLLECVAEAVREVEAAAGLCPEVGPRLLVGPVLPGAMPVAPGTARAHLGDAGARGLPAPLRRRQPVAGWTAVWRSGTGSVLSCDGPYGTSAQAVIALRGVADISAIAPPPGGALVLRAWRTGRAWGLACGLVLGAAETLGLGREAGHTAARARAAGWDALVLSGQAALRLARCGDPGQPAPEAVASAASGDQVIALVEACLAAAGFGHLGAGSPWALAVTP